FGLVPPKRLELPGKNAGLRRHLPDGQQRRALRDIDIARHGYRGSPRPNVGLSHRGAPASGGERGSLLAAAAAAQPDGLGFPSARLGTRAPVAGRPVARPRTVASARYVSPELDEARRSVTDVSTWGSVAPARRAAASASSRAM